MSVFHFDAEIFELKSLIGGSDDALSIARALRSYSAESAKLAELLSGYIDPRGSTSAQLLIRKRSRGRPAKLATVSSGNVAPADITPDCCGPLVVLRALIDGGYATEAAQALRTLQFEAPSLADAIAEYVDPDGKTSRRLIIRKRGRGRPLETSKMMEIGKMVSDLRDAGEKRDSAVCKVAKKIHLAKTSVKKIYLQYRSTDFAAFPPSDAYRNQDDGK